MKNLRNSSYKLKLALHAEIKVLGQVTEENDQYRFKIFLNENPRISNQRSDFFCPPAQMSERIFIMNTLRAN